LARFAGCSVFRLSLEIDCRRATKPVFEDLPHHGGRGRRIGVADVPVPLMAIRFRRFVIAANLVYAAVLLFLGVAPDLPNVAVEIPDFAAHGIAYAAHTALMFALLLPSIGRGRAAIFALAGAVLYGALVEALQLLQPARTVEFRDLLANSVGAGAAAMILYFVTGRRATGGCE
jgi:VanZ family protein